jgi:hypothetical protein
MALGMVAALIYLKRQFGGVAPLATVVRVAVSVAIAVAVARMVPGEGKLLTVVTLPLAGVIFLAALILLREFGTVDRAKFARSLGEKR